MSGGREWSNFELNAKRYLGRTTEEGVGGTEFEILVEPKHEAAQRDGVIAVLSGSQFSENYVRWALRCPTLLVDLENAAIIMARLLAELVGLASLEPRKRQRALNNLMHARPWTGAVAANAESFLFAAAAVAVEPTDVLSLLSCVADVQRTAGEFPTAKYVAMYPLFPPPSLPHGDDSKWATWLFQRGLLRVTEPVLGLKSVELIMSHRANDPVIRASQEWAAGLAAARQNDPHQALVLLRSAQGALPFEPGLALDLTEVLLNAGDVVAAEDCFRSIPPDPWPSREHILVDKRTRVKIRLHLATGRNLDALRETDTALASTRASADPIGLEFRGFLHHSRALLLWRLGRNSEALASAEEAVKIAGMTNDAEGTAASSIVLARVLLDLRRNSEAKTILRRYARVAPVGLRDVAVKLLNEQPTPTTWSTLYDRSSELRTTMCVDVLVGPAAESLLDEREDDAPIEVEVSVAEDVALMLPKYASLVHRGTQYDDVTVVRPSTERAGFVPVPRDRRVRLRVGPASRGSGALFVD